MSDKFLIVMLLFAALIAFKKITDRWTGFIYPNKSNLSNNLNIGKLKSLDECRIAAFNSLRKISSLSQGDFECGLLAYIELNRTQRKNRPQGMYYGK
jgi:hypothetical protein